MKSRYLGRKPVVVDGHRTFCSICWYCAEQLSKSFTTVRKGEQDLKVHYGCRVPAEDLIAGKWIQENPDTFLPIG